MAITELRVVLLGPYVRDPIDIQQPRSTSDASGKFPTGMAAPARYRRMSAAGQHIELRSKSL